MKATKTQAKNLATGDRVYFPRAGWREIKKIVGANNLAVTFMFAGGEARTFESSKEVYAEISEREVSAASAEDIYRLDIETGRVSLTSRFYLFSLKDIGASFKPCANTNAFAETVAAAELRRGARLFTSKAIYWTEPAPQEFDNAYAA